MSHRRKSACCCEDAPEVPLGTCFTGFGAVPKTNFNPPCSPGSGGFNRHDNWELCSHNNRDEEVLLALERKAWSSTSVAVTPSNPSGSCKSCSTCPGQNVGWGGIGTSPMYVWYAGPTSRKCLNEPGARLLDCFDGGNAVGPDDDIYYTWYHTSDNKAAASYDGWFNGFYGARGGLNFRTWPLHPNPRDIIGQLSIYVPPGGEGPCCGRKYGSGAYGSHFSDRWCRLSYFSQCHDTPDGNLLYLPFSGVVDTPVPVTDSQFQLIGDRNSRTNRWRTQRYGWLNGSDYRESCEDRFVSPCFYGGDYFWLQDIIAESSWQETDKFYPHWNVRLAPGSGVLSVNQSFSFGQCGEADGTGSQPPHYGWPLGRTLIGVFHKERWWQRYWNSIDENDVCPDDDPNCGVCPGYDPDDGGCPDPNWSPADRDIYPGHFAACRSPKFVGYACAGIPVFSHEIMLNERLQQEAGAEIPGTIAEAFNLVNTGTRNAAEYIMIACAFDCPIPSRITKIMEEEGILPDPNPYLTEQDGDHVAYRIFKKKLAHFDTSVANGEADTGRCCVNFDNFLKGDPPADGIPGTPEGPFPGWGNCSQTSFRRDEGEELWGCDDTRDRPYGCVEYAQATWNPDNNEQFEKPQIGMQSQVRSNFTLETQEDVWEELRLMYNEDFTIYNCFNGSVFGLAHPFPQILPYHDQSPLIQISPLDETEKFFGCACHGEETALAWGMTYDPNTPNEIINSGPWNMTCVSQIHNDADGKNYGELGDHRGGTYCFPRELCVPNVREFICDHEINGAYTPELDDGNNSCEMPLLEGGEECPDLRTEIGTVCLFSYQNPTGSSNFVRVVSRHCLQMSKEQANRLLLRSDNSPIPIASDQLEGRMQVGKINPLIKSDIPLDNPTKVTCAEMQGGELTEDGAGEATRQVECPGCNSLFASGQAGGFGPNGSGAAAIWTPLTLCNPIEETNNGAGPCEQECYEAELNGEEGANEGRLNYCTHNCNVIIQRSLSTDPERRIDVFDSVGPFATDPFVSETCDPKLEIPAPEVDPVSIPGSPCNVPYKEEDHYFYGRPGGWSWICVRDLNVLNMERFPQVQRTGVGCGCQDDPTCNAQEQAGEEGGIPGCGLQIPGGFGTTSLCKVSPAGGPGCWSAAPYPARTYSTEVKGCCCNCTSSFSGFNVQCENDSDCASGGCLGQCAGGLCSIQCNPDAEPGEPCACPQECDGACAPGQEENCYLSSLSSTGEPICEAGGDPCLPPLIAICGSGCNDAGDDSGGEGCQPADAGVGSIGTEAQNFCSHMAVSQTCQGAWFQQIGTSLRDTGDEEDRIQYQCTYENNAFWVVVDCPEQDQERAARGRPGCKDIFREYDISWVTTYAPDPEDPSEEPEQRLIYIPKVNGITAEVGYTPGYENSASAVPVYLEFYSGGIHKIKQSHPTNGNAAVSLRSATYTALM